MFIRLIVLVVLFGGAERTAQAQSIPLLDLGGIRSRPGSPASPYGQVLVGFPRQAANCPEQYGTIEIKAGVLSLHRPEGRSSVTMPEPDPETRPINDFTWQYRVKNVTCRLTLDIKLMLRTNEDPWQPAILPYTARPSVTKDEKIAFMRDLRERAIERAKTTPPPKWIEGPPWSLGGSGSTSIAFFFEKTEGETPLANCFHAVGSYHVNRRGVAFTFLGELGELNRFAILRTVIDEHATQLDFIGGDCRLQITIRGSISNQSDWTPILLN